MLQWIKRFSKPRLAGVTIGTMGVLTPKTERLCICIPTNQSPKPGFAFSVDQFLLALRFPDCPIATWDVAIVFGDGSVIHDSREKLAQGALDMDSSKILFIDDDMTFAPQTVYSLVSRNQPFVACNYPRRKAPHHWAASRADLRGLIATRPDSTGIEPAHGLGFGMVLMDAKVLRAIPRPRFLPTWCENAGGFYVSEDVMFCRRATEAGFRPHVDHDASKLIGHCSERVLSYLDGRTLTDAQEIV